MKNKDYIEAYKTEQKIITDFYKIKQNGKMIDVIGIINPLKIDNRQLMAPTDNQGSSPHCAAYSAATLIESIYWKKYGKLKQLDSHQVYALAKQIDGQINLDGTYLETALHAVLKLCTKDDEFNFLKDAKVEMFYNGNDQATIENVKHLIHKNDFLQVGFNIDEGWYDCTNKMFVLRSRGRSLGGHAVNVRGYDSDGFYVLNQWSPSFGAKGYAIMPYELFLRQFMYGTCISNFTY